MYCNTCVNRILLRNSSFYSSSRLTSFFIVKFKKSNIVVYFVQKRDIFLKQFIMLKNFFADK